MDNKDLINHFWKVRRGNRITSTQADLYFCLLQESNERNWENPFAFSDIQICARIGISESTLTDARTQLKQFGLIDFDTGKQGIEYPTYEILCLNNLSITFSKDRVKTEQKNRKCDQCSIYFLPEYWKIREVFTIGKN